MCFDADHAREGMRMFDPLRNVDAHCLAFPRGLHQAGVSDDAASAKESARNILRPSNLCDAWGLFNRPKFARALSRAVVPSGFHLRSDLVAAIPGGKGGRRLWLADSVLAARDLKVERKGGLRRVQAQTRDGDPRGYT